MKQYFLIGIKGKGMQALAKYLSMEGNKVEGYDDNKEKDSVYLELEKYGIIIYENYNINNLSDKEIIVAPAIPKEKLKEVPNFKYYNEFIADITKNNNTICVAGSFGKTTTSTFLFQILNSITGCNCIIGDGTGFNNKKNDILVLESCEFRKHFLSYQATDVIITNIGLEHTDCYKDFNEIAETFIEFSNKCLGKKIIYGDIEDIDYNKFKGNVYTYGFNNDNDTIIRKTNYIDNTTYILLEYNKTEYSFEIPLRLAKHQILDLVATITYCFSKSYSKEQIKKGLANISLPKYRYVEEKINGIDTISDFCGHYAGIKSNL